MNMVITTGCPNSGWEMALPILQQSGLELAGASFNRLLDECLQAAGAGDTLQILQPILPESGLGGHVSALLSKYTSSPVVLADSRSIWLLDFWAKQFPQAQFLFFYTRAETALAHALQQEVDPRQFLEQWQAANRQLLNFHRRHRQRTLLLDAEAVSLHPQALETACRRIGLMLKPAANFPTPAIALSPMERLLAAYLLVTQPAVQSLQMELEASSQPLGDITPKIQLQPAELLDSFRQSQACQRQLQQQLDQAQQTLVKQETTRKEMAQENELLLLQLHQVQEELEATFLMEQKIERAQKQQAAERQELNIQLDQAQQALQMQEATHREMVQENEQRLQQLHQVQEELGATFLLKQQIEQAQKQQDAERQKLNIQLEQAQQTLQKQEAAHRETAQENELLLLQLHQVQEELEHYFLKYQELTDERQRELQAKDGETDKSRLRKKVSQILSWNIAAQPIARLFKNTNSERNKIQKQVDWLKASGLFDETWYLAVYPDVANAGIDPVKHYLCHGASEGRNPSPRFNTRYYLATNPDIAATGVNPLVHFGKSGKAEGRLHHKPKSATWK